MGAFKYMPSVATLHNNRYIYISISGCGCMFNVHDVKIHFRFNQKGSNYAAIPS